VSTERVSTGLPRLDAMPQPMRKVIGDLSNLDSAMVGLRLETETNG
jgi:hypothetical protein